MVTAEIITIGDEILIGQIVDTNSSWLAALLNNAGFTVVNKTAVADTPKAITEAVEQSFKRAQLVITTGGLGPTKDDKTKATLASFFNDKLELFPEVEQHIKGLFSNRNIKFLDVHLAQAYLPSKCIPLSNRMGTAAGMWFSYEHKVLVSLPGVPYEMKTIAQEELLPKLKETFNTPFIYHKTIMTAGTGETVLAHIIENIENTLPHDVSLAYLPKPGMVRIRISAMGSKEKEVKARVDEVVQQVYTALNEYAYGYDEMELEQAVGDLLLEQKSNLALAESCTGGYMGNLLTLIAGSSAYFEGSIVSYSYAIKEKVLGVKHETLLNYGAVSEQTVVEMALGVKNIMNTQYAIAVSGIAGPGGATPEKPVGSVWIAIATPQGTHAKLFNFGGRSRQLNIELTAKMGLYQLWRLLKGLEIN